MDTKHKSEISKGETGVGSTHQSFNFDFKTALFGTVIVNL